VASSLEPEAPSREEWGGRRGMDVRVPAETIIVVAFEVFKAYVEENVVVNPFVQWANAMEP